MSQQAPALDRAAFELIDLTGVRIVLSGPRADRARPVDLKSLARARSLRPSIHALLNADRTSAAAPEARLPEPAGGPGADPATTRIVAGVLPVAVAVAAAEVAPAALPPPGQGAPPAGAQALSSAVAAARLGHGSRLARLRPVWTRSTAMDPSVTRVLLGAALVAAYTAICLAPLAVVSIGYPAPRRPFLVELSVALGYVGLAMMTLQFTLVSRIRWLAAPFGIDILHRFHREVSFAALAFIFAHPLLLLAEDARSYLPLLDPWTAPWRARLAVGSLAALILVVALSVWRRRLRLPYEVWKVTHGGLSTAVIVLGLSHMVGVNRFTSGAGGRAVVVLVLLAVAGVLVWSRIVAPRVHLFRPWRVVDVIRERGRAVTLVVRPDGHPGWSFMPGQFAWLTVGGSPFQVTRQHPFSFSSPADVEPGGRVAVTIKELGDWTRRVGSVQPGQRIYLDGPHGSFSIDRRQAPGYVFVAGGVGITPIFSMISTMCLRDDTRPAILFYANAEWENITFRDQLEELRLYMPNLRVVHVLQSPPPGWAGERGRVTAELLARHLPRQYRSFECFVCGPESMMDSVEQALLSLGVPGYRITSERFNMV